MSPLQFAVRASVQSYTAKLENIVHFANAALCSTKSWRRSSVINEVFANAKERMTKALDAARDSFATIRTGRANPALLQDVMVDYYAVSSSPRTTRAR